MTTNSRLVPYNQLVFCDLIVDAQYETGPKGNFGGDPIAALLTMENQGGFRKKGNTKVEPMKLDSLALYSSLCDLDWPDQLNSINGVFTYYGDNKQPGYELHDTPKKGNSILRFIFECNHNNRRNEVPPIFIFTQGDKSRDVVFRGLAVPGAININEYDDLVAIWKTKGNQRFQNYRAIFSILDVQKIDRAWINDINNHNPFTKNAPKEWITWVESGKIKSLLAENTIEYRTKTDQQPDTPNDSKILKTVYDYFSDPYKFEHFAAKLFQMMDPNVVSINTTRAWKDGGLDAYGHYRIGFPEEGILVEFALEAKRYEKISVGVKETSRLISRIKHRQFGVIITTSYFHVQAQKEIKEDGHPIIMISGREIVKILRNHGIDNSNKCLGWLISNF